MKPIGTINSITNTRTRRGFSLTEFAIVLFIASIIIGGVWVLADRAWDQTRQEHLKNDITSIARNVQGLYGGQFGLTAATYPAVTPTLVVQGVFPGELVRSAGCTNPLPPAPVPAPYGSVSYCVDHPWGAGTGGSTAALAQTGSLGVCGWISGGTTCAAGAQQLFAVEIRGLTDDQCIQAALNNSGSDVPAGFADVVINGTSIMSGAGVTHQLPVLLTDASRLCPNADPVIDFVYQLIPVASP